MAFKLRQLQYFIAVARHRLDLGAAQLLSISQSTVTESVKELKETSASRFWSAMAAA